ncbi:MAG: FAD-dependent oxidoreductase [Chloroflexota bacterium]|nr:FAD-dependent oxidoreductase [Chloroflexota bacterium]
MTIGRSKPDGAVLVVGGGVGGMRAAVDLAEAGLKVFLIEREATLGGRVAQLGYMFPTHDCVLCRGTSDHGYGCTRPAISPAFMDNNVHPNIEIMTLTEILAASGSAGDFAIDLRHHPRYVAIDKCTNCGLCAVVCPVHLPSEFEESIVTQMAVHKSAPRSLPDAYFIDKGDYCEDCGRCVEVCPTDAIDLDETIQDETIRVSAIILALGYNLSDASVLEEYGYGRYPNVIHSMQYERYVSRSGPTEGMVMRPSDNQSPKRIAWLQCIGSRDQEHPYCSSICCMYATKEAVLAKQRLDGVDCRVFMMDERAFNKEFNAYFHRSRDEFGVDYVRCRISGLKEDPLTSDLILRYPSDGNGTMVEERFDMVVLSVGVQPPGSAESLAGMMGFDLNDYGFCATDKFAPLETSQPGIYVCGAFASPKEIAETIIDASGAAGDVMRLFHGELGQNPSSREFPFLSKGAAEFPPERDVSGEPPRVGVFVCECGPSIGGVVDVNRVVDQAQRFPNVVHAANVDYGCFPAGMDAIKDAIAEHSLNRVVIGACSHRTHEPLFQRTVRQAGLNAYLMEMANIREQCAWVHPHEPEKATRKALELIRMATARASVLEPVHKAVVEPARRALVVGGGVSGMTAALAIADGGFEVVLVERSETLGGNLQNIHFVVEGYNPRRLRRDLVNRVRSHERISVHSSTELAMHAGHVGNYRAILRSRDGSEQVVAHGVTIVATGGQEARGRRYLLAEHEKVITQLELEEAIAYRLDEIARLKHVVMIQCVKPDNVEHDYCSRVCCTSTIKNAMRIKVANPDCQVTVLYKDIITYGFREQYYTEARRRGVVFVRYDDEHEPVVEDAGTQGGGDAEISVRVYEPTFDQWMTLNPDLLVLSMAIQPSDGTDALADLLGVPLSVEGFYQEAHVKMRPMDFTDEGIFVAGMAHYPKFIEESISHALATAGRAMTILSKQPLFMGGTIAIVDQDKCVGCLTCVRTCPFNVPKIDYEKAGVGGIIGAAYIEPALCQGCGTCTADCPASAIQVLPYADDLMLQSLSGVLGSWVPVVP